MHNADVAQVFEEIADLLEIEAANPFRVRAYRTAARTLRDLPREITAMLVKKEDLNALPGIGHDLAGKIQELLQVGPEKFLEQYRLKVPRGIVELLKVPGLGPKRVKMLYRDLGIQSLSQVEEAARDGRIRTIRGFGKTIEQRILESLKARAAMPARVKLATATQYADAVVSYLKASRGVQHVTVAGSYRRGLETIGDLDILVTAGGDTDVMERFVGYPEVAEVLARGETRATVRLASNLHVDLRLVGEECYGAALLYFTGSKAHNIALRHLGQRRGLKINEYGVFQEDQRIAGSTEDSVYETVGLPFIHPELRENRGEIEAAYAGKLPTLVALTDLKGDLHAHTKATDGRSTLHEMAEAARERHLEYLAITDHSKRLTMTRGLDAERLLLQMEEIDRLNENLSGITLLKGIEVDILKDGSLDLPDDILARLDIVVGAVHSHFDLPREKQTQRILRAMERPHFDVLAHPTGRLLQQREAYDVDMGRILRQAHARRCFLEVNAQPDRLDLTDTYCQMAKAEGVLCCINTDAHSVYELDFLRFGVGQARRGWLEVPDVLNTRPLSGLRRLLRS